MVSEPASIDPLSPATPVADPEIAEVIDLHTGDILDVPKFIVGHRFDEFIRLRGIVRERLKTEKPLFACAICGTPAYIVANKKKRFFFRHDIEDGSCAAHTRGELSQDEIDARKYHGQRESEAHKRIKGLIERSLKADPAFAAVTQEKVWRSARDPAAWRQPDVQAHSAIFGSLAFEVQLSTTFLNVVVERRVFYREQGALLVWVFGHFTPEYRRLMVDDILFPNNSNLFVVDDETTRVSEERGAFHMRCFFRRPQREGAAIIDQWEERLVSFGDLERNVEAQTAFFFDYAGEETRLRATIAAEAQAARGEADEALRLEFFDLFEQAAALRQEDDSEFHERWRVLVDAFDRRKIEIPFRHPDGDSGFRALVIGILSAKAGAPVGWNYKKLVQVAHRLFDGHKTHLRAFGYAIRYYCREEQLLQEDKSGAWAQRKREVRDALRRHDPAYEPDSRWLPALVFLFPEIGSRVQAYVERIEEIVSAAIG